MFFIFLLNFSLFEGEVTNIFFNMQIYYEIKLLKF